MWYQRRSVERWRRAVVAPPAALAGHCGSLGYPWVKAPAPRALGSTADIARSLDFVQGHPRTSYLSRRLPQQPPLKQPPESTQENSPRVAGVLVSKPAEGAAEAAIAQTATAQTKPRALAPKAAAAAAAAQRSFKRTTPWQCQGVVCLNGAGGIRTPVPRRPLYRIYERVRDLNLVRGIRSRRAPTPDQPDCCLVPQR